MTRVPDTDASMLPLATSRPWKFPFLMVMLVPGAGVADVSIPPATIARAVVSEFHVAAVSQELPERFTHSAVLYTAVTVPTTSAAPGPVGFFTRPDAVMRHSHFHAGLVGTLTSDPDQVTESAPTAAALATVVPDG
jgi:hypothetical protein